MAHVQAEDLDTRKIIVYDDLAKLDISWSAMEEIVIRKGSKVGGANS